MNYYKITGEYLKEITEICETLSKGEMLIFSNPNDPLPDNNSSNILLPSNICQCIN